MRQELSQVSSASLIWRQRISICLSSLVWVTTAGVGKPDGWGMDPYWRSYLCFLRQIDAIFLSCSIFHFRLRQQVSSWWLLLNQSTAVFFMVGFPCQVATPLCLIVWVGATWWGWVDGGGEGESKTAGCVVGGRVSSHWSFISRILSLTKGTLLVLHPDLPHWLVTPPWIPPIYIQLISMPSLIYIYHARCLHLHPLEQQKE